ncbi:MAG: hypothetical protein ACTHXA_06605 [Gulosibacter sp.]|uniref:hypothetical protein n=1 Tax=Gulosibacter sp. TaxID=2817531 RepID=UPI003F8FA2E9
MTNLQFRNLSVTPADPVEMWGFEGYVTALERGDFEDWHRMRIYARQHPWSEVTDAMLEATEQADDFGIGSAALVRLAITRARQA